MIALKFEKLNTKFKNPWKALNFSSVLALSDCSIGASYFERRERESRLIFK